LAEARIDDICVKRRWQRAIVALTSAGRVDNQEDAMAKGQMKGNKEAKKPKGEKPKGAGSTYKQAQGKGGPVSSPFVVKK
jgi:hypothetical protein